MCGGVDRYYQIARCFRDEDLRADRQPEFTQLDIEMAFMDQKSIMSLSESMIRTVFQEAAGISLPDTIPVMTYDDAISAYGSDKPDLRFGMPYFLSSAHQVRVKRSSFSQTHRDYVNT